MGGSVCKETPGAEVAWRMPVPASGGALIGGSKITPSRNPPADKGALGFGERETVTGAEEDGAGARQLECSDNTFTKESYIHRHHRRRKEHTQDFHPNRARRPEASAGSLASAPPAARPTAVRRGVGRLQPRPDPAGASPAKAQKSRGRGPTTRPAASHHRRGIHRIRSRGARDPAIESRVCSRHLQSSAWRAA